MSVCPACGSATDDRSQRCSQCGAQLSAAQFETSVPATRRMGHTMLGVAPQPDSGGKAVDGTGGSVPDPASSESSGSPIGGFATLEPAPGTLTGLKPATLNDTSPVEQTSDSLPQTLTGVADPKRTLPLASSRTLMGFGAALGEHPNTSANTEAEPTAGTLRGIAESNAGEPRPDPVANAVSTNATLVAVSPMTGDAEPVPSQQATRKVQFKGTLLGVAPIQFANPPAPDPARIGEDAAPATPPMDPIAQAANPTPPAVRHHATMLGVAPPLQAVNHTLNATAPANPQPAFGEASRTPVAATPPAAGYKGTLLGVAMPGIAPLQPGQAKPVPATERPQNPVIASAAPRVHPGPSTGRAVPAAGQRDLTERASQQRRLAWVFGTAAALLVALIVVALGVWWKSVHLTVEVISSESGNEQLVLSCSNCPDGTKATVDAKTATFKANGATVELTRRLAIGQNQIALQVVRPNRTRGETVNVTVPVDFRVTSSVAELLNDPPSVSVDLEATAGARFVLDGRTYSVGPTGSLKVPIDVSAMLMGPAATVVPFERRLAYEVIRDSYSTKGTLVVRTGITPLEVATPGSAHVTQNATFTLSGRTSANAKLTANGHAIAVAADGSFRQEMALSAPGATKLYVRALESNQAPRTVEVALERVTNLKQRAEELARPLLTDFDAISSLANEKPDSVVALHGELVAIESVGALTRIVGTSNCRQGPCLSSIRYGGTVTLRRGSKFIALGKARLTQRANSAEHDLTLDASLVVEDTGR